MLGRKAQLIRREDILVFGIDSILTRSSDVIIENRKEIKDVIQHKILRGREGMNNLPAECEVLDFPILVNPKPYDF